MAKRKRACGGVRQVGARAEADQHVAPTYASLLAVYMVCVSIRVLSSLGICLYMNVV